VNQQKNQQADEQKNRNSASEPVEKIADHANRSGSRFKSSRSFAGRIRAVEL
jgi:hypothetical protein